MKKLKDSIKLDRHEKRVGNIIVRDEKTHMKVSDLTGVVSWRLSAGIPAGDFCKLYYDSLPGDVYAKGFANYASAVLLLLTTVPDIGFLEDVCAAAKACIERHPDIYGYPSGEVSDAEDAEVIGAEKEIAGYVERLKMENGKEG